MYGILMDTMHLYLRFKRRDDFFRISSRVAEFAEGELPVFLKVLKQLVKIISNYKFTLCTGGIHGTQWCRQHCWRANFVGANTY